MLKTPTTAKLEELGLTGMLQAFIEQNASQDTFKGLSFDERFALIVDREDLVRGNKNLARRLKNARLRHDACMEDIDFRHQRNLDKATILALGTSQWTARHQNILITGPTGVGKSFLACALSHRACQQGYGAVYYRATQLFTAAARARAEGRYDAWLRSIQRMDVLVIDDFGLMKLADDERTDLLEVLEDRHGRKSTIVTSQLSVDKWFETIGNPTLADAILDRLVHNSHKLALNGVSLRKIKPQEPKETQRKADK